MRNGKKDDMAAVHLFLYVKVAPGKNYDLGSYSFNSNINAAAAAGAAAGAAAASAAASTVCILSCTYTGARSAPL